jgi:hypothetical protein
MASLPSKKKPKVYILTELPLPQNVLNYIGYLFITYFSLSSQYTQHNYPMNSITCDLTDFNGVAF